MPLRETTFIERNLSTWRDLESELERPRPDPDRVRDLYAAVSDDLSYARTHYPNRSVRSYLNAQAAALALSLHRNRRSRAGAFLRFWTVTVPLELYSQRYALLAALGLFLLAFGIGWGSSAVDAGFAELVLGADYVTMTEANIEAGNVLGVYKDGSMLGGSLGIAGNNLFVAMLTFVGGLLFGLGSVFVILYNGIMVGVFQHFFFARGVGWESALGIWTHGTIEISCIVVAGGAGFALARGLLWPGALSRSRAFQLTALSALRIMAGIVPLIILAGFIEGFLTRMDTWPLALRIGFVFANVAFVIGYFVVLPHRVGRYGERPDSDYGALPPDSPLVFPDKLERPVSEIFFDTVRYLGRQGGAVLLSAVLLGLLAGTVYVLFSPYEPIGATYFDSNIFGPDIHALLGDTSLPGTIALVAIGAVVGPFATRWLFRPLALKPVEGSPPGTAPTPAASTLRWANLAAVWLLMLGSAYLDTILLVALLPFYLLWMRALSYNRGGLLHAFRESLTFEFADLAAVLRLWSLLLSFTWTAGLLLETGFVQRGVELLQLNLPPSLGLYLNVRTWLAVSFDFAVLFALAAVWIFAFGQLYNSLRERYTAAGLHDRLQSVLAE